MAEQAERIIEDYQRRNPLATLERELVSHRSAVCAGVTEERELTTDDLSRQLDQRLDRFREARDLPLAFMREQAVDHGLLGRLSEYLERDPEPLSRPRDGVDALRDAGIRVAVDPTVPDGVIAGYTRNLKTGQVDIHWAGADFPRIHTFTVDPAGLTPTPELERPMPSGRLSSISGEISGNVGDAMASLARVAAALNAPPRYDYEVRYRMPVNAFMRNYAERWEAEHGVPWCAPYRGAAMTEDAPAEAVSALTIFGERMHELGRALVEHLSAGMRRAVESAGALGQETSPADELQAKREKSRANRALPMRTLSKAHR